MIRNRFVVMMMLLALALVLLAGCSSDSKMSVSPSASPSATAVKSKDPVTLKMLVWDVSLSDENFKKWIAEPVKKKYPNITVELVRRVNNMTLAQVVAAGDFADFVYEGNKFVAQFVNFKVIDDMSPYVQKNKTDLNRFEPTFLDSLKAYGEKGELYAMPLAMTYDALFYNKDLFNKFNVPYPKDNMTWDDVYDLMKKLTRKEGDIQYHGIRIVNNVEAFASPMALPAYNNATGKATINTDGWKKAFTTFRDFKNYPGNDTGDDAAIDMFISTQEYAMLTDTAINPLGKIEEAAAKGVQLNWDMVKYPQFPGYPQRGLELNGHVLLMGSGSKYKDDVYDVITFLMDKDIQTMITQDGRMLSADKDPAIRKRYGENFPTVKGKNMAPILDQAPAPAADRVGNAAIARTVIRPAAASSTDFMKGAADVNTTLAKAEEAANKAIQDAAK